MHDRHLRKLLFPDSWFCFKYNHCLPLPLPYFFFFFLFTRSFCKGKKAMCGGVSAVFSFILLVCLGWDPIWWCQDMNFIVTSPSLIPGARFSVALFSLLCPGSLAQRLSRNFTEIDDRVKILVILIWFFLWFMILPCLGLTLRPWT